MLDERIPGDGNEIDRLRASAQIISRDLYPDQLAELGALRGVLDSELAEPPRWVHYPWRNTVARVLGPNGYRRLRLDRNRNKITAEEQAFYSGLRIGVVGASVGHLVTLGLAMEGLFGAARITDFDSVELTNLNRLPGSVLDYGLNKTVVLARRIAELDPYLVVEPMLDGIEVASTEAFVDGLDLIVEVCDSLDVKLALREQARLQKVPVVMVTSDRGTVDVERFDIDPIRLPFHGLAGGLTSDTLAALTTAEKVPYVMNIVGSDGLSARMAASMLEIDETLTAWPHLAGDALQAAAGAVMAVRRFGQRAGLPSGRLHIDIASSLDRLADPAVPVELPGFAAGGAYRNLAGPRTTVEAVVRAGQLAPSGGNCQPWRIALDDAAEPRAVRIELDDKQTTAMDIDFRASHVAIGAAVLNMRIAASAHSLLGAVELFPDGPEATTVAVLRLGVARDEQLAQAYLPMLRRVTNRNVMAAARPIPESDLADLAAAARSHQGELGVVDTAAELAEVADILADADRLRFLLPTLHGEMMAELRDPRTDAIDRGIDVRTLELGPATAMLDIARRSEVMTELAEHDLGRALGGRVRLLVESSSAVVAVSIAGIAPDDYVRGGQAMQSVWIAATAAGLAVQPIVPLFMFARSERELRDVAGGYADRLADARRRLYELMEIQPDRGFVMVLRLGYAPAPTAVSLRSTETIVPAGI